MASLWWQEKIFSDFWPTIHRLIVSRCLAAWSPIWSGGNFHCTWWQEGKARGTTASVLYPPKGIPNMPHLPRPIMVIQMSARRQCQRGGSARSGELSKAWCRLSTTACQRDDSQLNCNIYWSTAFARIIVSCFELWEKEEGEVGALCFPPFCAKPGKGTCCLESCFVFNWWEEACESLQLSACVMISWQCEVSLRAVTALLSCQ